MAQLLLLYPPPPSGGEGAQGKDASSVLDPHLLLLLSLINPTVWLPISIAQTLPVSLLNLGVSVFSVVHFLLSIEATQQLLCNRQAQTQRRSSTFFLSVVRSHTYIHRSIHIPIQTETDQHASK